MTPSTASDNRKTQAIDSYIGKQIRLRRLDCELSQHQLASALGISYQQLQKYERGTNRISASRLYALGLVLGVDTNYFFSGMPADIAESLKPQEGSEPLDIVAQRTRPPHIRAAMLALVDAINENHGNIPQEG